MTKYHPRNTQVLVLPDGGKTKDRGLIVPEAYVKIPSVGTAVEVGPGFILENGERGKLDLEPNTRVDFILHAGTQAREIDGVLHYLMPESDILAIITDEPIPEPVMPGDEEESDGTGMSEDVESMRNERHGNGSGQIVLASR